MPGSISQMQMVYNPEEDRILFRVNSTESQEFRFWITRRYAFLLQRVLVDYLEADPDVLLQPSPEGRQAIKQFKQDKALVGANFDEAFREEAPSLPLGPDILLAYKLTYTREASHLRLSILPREGEGINIVINREINASLMSLLDAATKKAGWALSAGGDPLTVGNQVVN